VGFAFDVEAVRELVHAGPTGASAAPELVAYAEASQLAAALDALEALHREGTQAELLPGPVPSRAQAEAIAAERGCPRVHWLAS
jgi:ATP phosphoribosyltransferase regulatory subunit